MVYFTIQVYFTGHAAASPYELKNILLLKFQVTCLLSFCTRTHIHIKYIHYGCRPIQTIPKEMYYFPPEPMHYIKQWYHLSTWCVCVCYTRCTDRHKMWKNFRVNSTT